MHIFRLYPTSVKVHVQEKYLFSRKSLSKEVPVLKKYPNKCPKKYSLQKRSSFKAEADQEMLVVQRNLLH